MSLGKKVMVAVSACLASVLLSLTASNRVEAKVERAQIPPALGSFSELIPYGTSQLLLFEPWEGVLARVNKDGSPDPSFGVEGLLKTRFSDVAVDHSGKILLSGVRSAGATPTNSDAAIRRLLPDGGIDRSFGVEGTALVDMGGAYDRASAVAVARDGRIIVGGARQSSPDNRGMNDGRPAVARLFANGAVDRSFGHEGVRLLRRGWEGGVWDVFPIAGGDFIADGEGYLAHSIWRLTADGSEVRGYNPDGVVDQAGRRPPGRGSGEEESVSWVERIAVTPNGAAYVGAVADPFKPLGPYRCVLLRLTPSGKVDRSFGQSGWATASFGAAVFAEAVITLPHGISLIAGSVDRGRHGRDVALTAFDRRGQLVRGFGRRGKLRVAVRDRTVMIQDATAQAGRAVVLVETPRHGIWLLRLPAIR